MASYNDKSEKGTPGLLFRQRLEYGVGLHNLAGKWDLLWSMHSHQCSANPTDISGVIPVNCVHTIAELLQQNDDELLKYVRVSLLEDTTLLTDAQKIEYIQVLAQCLKRLDEISYRANLYESVKASEGTRLP
jgi:hypothetical protein